MVLYSGDADTGKQRHEKIQTSCNKNEIPYFYDTDIFQSVTSFGTPDTAGRGNSDIWSVRTFANCLLFSDTMVSYYHVFVLYRMVHVQLDAGCHQQRFRKSDQIFVNGTLLAFRYNVRYNFDRCEMGADDF